MPADYQHLGAYSDWPQAAAEMWGPIPTAAPGAETQARVREVLRFGRPVEEPMDVRSERRWERDGLLGEELTWSVEYGPRTHAWLLKPDTPEPLPGVLALHDHGGFKYFGKEKIADGPDAPQPDVVEHRREAYGGRAFANALAREGYVVLVPDTFLWGSRRFALEAMPAHDRQMAQTWVRENASGSPQIALYNTTAAFHEHLVEKYCTVLGTTLAGVIAFEDRVAAAYLASRGDVLPGGLGCIGLSGGGLRSSLLQATCDRIRAAVVVGLMSTYGHLLDHNIASHTWMLFPAGWSRYGDWPDLAACRAPSPLLVQYDLEDPLFTEEGMRAAHAKLCAHYRGVGHPEAYVGQFYPGPHKFDLPMQTAAFAWLGAHLRGA